jgi:hypothetical protein
MESDIKVEDIYSLLLGEYKRSDIHNVLRATEMIIAHSVAEQYVYNHQGEVEIRLPYLGVLKVKIKDNKIDDYRVELDGYVMTSIRRVLRNKVSPLEESLGREVREVVIRRYDEVAGDSSH